MGIESFDEQYSQFYDLLYHDKDYEKEAVYINRLIKKYRPDAKSILELGCGTGRHATIMRGLGYEIFGIDRSEALLRVSKSRGVECEQGDIMTFHIHRNFDVCMAMFHVISYLNADGDLETALRNIRDHLVTKGLFIFDVWFTPGVLHLLPQVREKKASDEQVEITRTAYPSMDNSNNTVTIKYNFTVTNKETDTVNSFEELHMLRHFDIPEIEMIAKQSGFSMLKAEEFVSGEEPSDRSWGVNFILQAQ